MKKKIEKQPIAWQKNQGPGCKGRRLKGRRPRAGGTSRTGCWREYDVGKVARVAVDARTVMGGPENTGCDGRQWSWSEVAAVVMGEEEDG